MTTKKNPPTTKTKKEPKVKKDTWQERPTVAFARDGHQIATLLWAKILASSTPEVREMLFVRDNLAEIWDTMAPSDFERVPRTQLTHENLFNNIQKAEFLLTGATFENTRGLPEGFEKGK